MTISEKFTPEKALSRGRRLKATNTNTAGIVEITSLYRHAFLLVLCISLFAIVPAIGAAPVDLTYRDELIRRAADLKLADTRYWRLLLHCRPNAPGKGCTSAIDDPTFFLATNGKTDPQAELEATLLAFFSTDEKDNAAQPAQCAYIARYQWLKSVLMIDERRLPSRRCDQFQEWLADLNPAGLTLVFPSAYMNNPASMFGHTLLRIDQRGQTEQTRLLAYSINFGAKDTDTNWVNYILSGVGGGFRGYFFIKPYYLLVKEYGDVEDRDIWEYRLHLTEPQLTRLLMHVWELQDSYFDYFFFSENCSYQLLPLLEVANPELSLIKHFPAWTIPADTIRLLVAQPGLVSDIAYRPAPSTEIRRRSASLSASERRMVTSFLRDPTTLTAEEVTRVPPPRLALTLEQAIAYAQYQQAKEQKQRIEPEHSLLHSLLVARNRLAVSSPTVPATPFATQPDVGHNSLRVGVGMGWRGEDWFEEITARAGYHDLLDPSPGYTPDAQIEVLALSLRRYHRQHRFRLDRLTLVNAISLSPIEPLFFAPSWKGQAGLHTLNRKRCRYCQNFAVNGGLGLAAQTQWLGREVYFFFPEVAVNVSRALAHDHRIGAGGTLGVLLHLSDHWKVMLSGTHLRYPLGDTGQETQGMIGQQYSFHRNWGVRLEFRHQPHDNEVSLRLHTYF